MPPGDILAFFGHVPNWTLTGHSCPLGFIHQGQKVDDAFSRTQLWWVSLVTTAETPVTHLLCAQSGVIRAGLDLCGTGISSQVS